MGHSTILGIDLGIAHTGLAVVSLESPRVHVAENATDHLHA